MDLNSTAELLELAARKLREADRTVAYWMKYAFRLEEEAGKLQPPPKGNVTKK